MYVGRAVRKCARPGISRTSAFTQERTNSSSSGGGGGGGSSSSSSGGSSRNERLTTTRRERPDYHGVAGSKKAETRVVRALGRKWSTWPKWCSQPSCSKQPPQGMADSKKAEMSAEHCLDKIVDVGKRCAHPNCSKHLSYRQRMLRAAGVEAPVHDHVEHPVQTILLAHPGLLALSHAVGRVHGAVGVAAPLG